MSDRIKISHYYTTGTTSPDVTTLEKGEIAISINANNERFYIRNTSDVLATFSSDTKFLRQSNTFNGNNTFAGSCFFNGPISFALGATFNNTINLSRNCSTVNINNITSSVTISGGDIIVCGTTTSSGGFFDTSDERLKNFGDNINVDFEKLKNLRKSYFTFKNDIDKKEHIGVSAQEVKKIFPEIVNEDSNGCLTVDYSKLSVISLAAIDKLNEKCENLEKRLQKIEEKLGCD